MCPIVQEISLYILFTPWTAFLNDDARGSAVEQRKRELESWPLGMNIVTDGRKYRMLAQVHFFLSQKSP